MSLIDLRKTEKPHNSNIELTDDGNGLKFIIPPNRSLAFGNLLIVIGLNLVSWYVFIMEILLGINTLRNLVGASVFIIIGFIKAVQILFHRKGQFCLSIGKSELNAHWELFGLSYRKGCGTEDISQIISDNSEECGIITLNASEEYGIVILLKNSKRIRFAASSDEERRWLVDRLYEIVSSQHDEISSVQESGQTDDSGGLYNIYIADSIVYTCVAALVLSGGIFILAVTLTGEFTLSDIPGTLFSMFWLSLAGRAFYSSLSRPYLITVAETELIFKSLVKKKSVSVESIKSAERKKHTCALHTEKDSIYFSCNSGVFNDFITRLAKKNSSFALKEM